MFVNRVTELDALARCYQSGAAEFFVLYGRRRVGKTALLRAFCEGKRCLFFVADMGTPSSSLAEFSRLVSTFAFGREDALGAFPSWGAAFAMVASHARTERLVVVLDEFTYLAEADPAFPSILQKAWDTDLKETRIMIILSGSYVGMMERQVLGYSAPLYGRRTGQWKLLPLSFGEIPSFLPSYGFDDLVRTYAVLGGVPAYLGQFDGGSTLGENLRRRVLSPGTFLYDEPRLLLLQELREPQRYFSILEAIAAGRTRQNEIAQAAGIAGPSVMFYLSTLRELGLVERAVPATEPHPHKSKLGLYKILDPFLRFWFRFVFPNRSRLDRGLVEPVAAEVEAMLDRFASSAFEAICREFVWRECSTGGLGGFTPRTVGGWWNRAAEIDVLAIGEGGLFAGECKWSVNPVGVDVLEDLKSKVGQLPDSSRGLQLTLGLFSRSGFSKALLEKAGAEGVQLFGPAELSRGVG